MLESEIRVQALKTLASENIGRRNCVALLAGVGGEQDPKGRHEEPLSSVVGNCVAGSVLAPLVSSSCMIADSQPLLHGFWKCGLVTIG